MRGWSITSRSRRSSRQRCDAAIRCCRMARRDRYPARASRSPRRGRTAAPIVFETGSGPARHVVRSGYRQPARPAASPANPLWNAGRSAPYWFDDSQRCLEGRRDGDVRPRPRLRVPARPVAADRDRSAETTADPPIRQIVQLLDAGDAGGSWATESATTVLSPVTADGPPWLTCPASRPPRWRRRPSRAFAGARRTNSRPIGRSPARCLPATSCRPRRAAPSGRSFVVGAPPPGDADAGHDRAHRRAAADGPRCVGQPGGDPALHARECAGDLAAAADVGPERGSRCPEVLLLQPNPRPARRRGAGFGSCSMPANSTSASRSIPRMLHVRWRAIPMARSRATMTATAATRSASATGYSVSIPDRGIRFAVDLPLRRRCSRQCGGGCDHTSSIQRRLESGNYLAVTTPLPAATAPMQQTLQSVQRLAPQAFRAQQFRAVIAADYKRRPRRCRGCSAPVPCLPLDRQLADRVHHTRPAGQQQITDRSAHAADRAAEPLSHGRLRNPTCRIRNTCRSICGSTSVRDGRCVSRRM